MLPCPRSSIKNWHRCGVFALESHWKTLQPVTCGLRLGSVETEHLCSESRQSSPLKALPEILLLFAGNVRTGWHRLAAAATSVCDIIATAAEKADEDPSGEMGIHLQVVS